MFSSVKSRLAAAAAAALLISGGVANAASLVNLEILGSTDGGNTWSQSLPNVAANSSILFEVVGVESPIGTSFNSITINSQGSGDGFGSMSYNLTDSDSGVIGNVALQNGYNGGTGANAGTSSGGTLTGARPILASGVLDAFTVFETGTLTVGSLSSTETLTPTFGGSTSGAKINTSNGVGGNSLVLNASSLASGEWSLSGLSIMGSETSPVPSPAVIPASVAFLSLAGFAALRRRFSAIA